MLSVEAASLFYIMSAVILSSAAVITCADFELSGDTNGVLFSLSVVTDALVATD